MARRLVRGGRPGSARRTGRGRGKRRPETPGADMLTARKWFGDMIGHCLEYAEKSKAAGRPIVGIMCEFTPRELIMAAGAVPVCLCGGDPDMIPPAERDLPATLCPLIKSTYGYSVEGCNPFLEMSSLAVAETTCDGKKKMFELMAEKHDMCVLELPQKENDRDGFRHWMSQLRQLKRTLESKLGAKITDAKLRVAARRMNRERSLRRSLAELMKSDAPPLTGRQLVDFRSSISCIPKDMEMYGRALAAGRTMRKLENSRKVRVLLTGVPMVSGAERVLELVEKNGGIVVCMESCTGVKPVLEDVDADAPDIMRSIAQKYFHLPCSVMTPNTRRLDNLQRLAREYRAECVIELVWQGCLTYLVESHLVEKLAKDTLGLPYLLIETDYSTSDSARLATRIAALFETVRHRAARDKTRSSGNVR